MHYDKTLKVRTPNFPNKFLNKFQKLFTASKMHSVWMSATYFWFEVSQYPPDFGTVSKWTVFRTFKAIDYSCEINQRLFSFPFQWSIVDFSEKRYNNRRNDVPHSRVCHLEVDVDGVVVVFFNLPIFLSDIMMVVSLWVGECCRFIKVSVNWDCFYLVKCD